MPVSQPLAVAALLVAMALWGSSFVALKIAFADYHPMWVIFLRMLVAAICFLFLLRRVETAVGVVAGRTLPLLRV